MKLELNKGKIMVMVFGCFQYIIQGTALYFFQGIVLFHFGLPMFGFWEVMMLWALYLIITFTMTFNFKK